MKKLVVALAAAIPLATIAADSEIRIDTAKLRTAVPASALIDKHVTAAGDRDAAEMEDIIISREGDVRFFLLEVEDESALANEQTARNDNAGFQQEDLAPGQDAAPEQAVSEDADWGDDEDFHDNEPMTEDVTADRAERENLEARGFAVDDEMRAIEPSDLSFTDKADDLRLSDNAQMHPVADDEDRIDGMLISEIIGMEVNMADEDSVGHVRM